MNIASLDLNLLRVFDALMLERSATRAGERIGLSQPAVSSALQRLRHIVGDKLFVREGNVMVPTSRAIALGPAVRQAMESIDRVFSEHSSFEPCTASRSFRLLGSDYFSTMLMPELSLRVVASAPNVLLQFLDGGPRAIPHALSEGTIDLTLGPLIEIPEWATFQFLFKSRLVMASKRGHPDLERAGVRAGGVVPLDLFCSLPQVLCSTDGGLSTAIDSALSARGRRRKIALTMPHFHTVALAIAKGHLVGSMPSQFATNAAKTLDLDLFELPFGDQDLDVGMYWHRRYDRDGAHMWLRDQVRSVLQAGLAE
jgi:DNA-binding transcriptional LysR family regulator